MAMTEQQIQLVLAAQKGDVKSFEALYGIYYEKVYGFARMILKNEREAEDVLQETFITAWRKLDTLQTPATFSVWIQVIAKNLCNMQLRRKNVVILLDAEQDIENIEIDGSEDLLPAVYAEREDLKERLSRIIEDLSDIQRQTIVLHYYNGLSVDEISDIMECSPGTVKSRLFLARKAIKAEVEEQERKTGQKFYGIVGIPMLSLDTLIRSHMESMSINQGAAQTSFNAITKSISDLNGTNTSVIASETQQTKTAEGIAAVKKLSTTTKIIAGSSAVAVLGAVAVLVMILAFGGNSETDPGTSPSATDSSDTPTEQTEPFITTPEALPPVPDMSDPGDEIVVISQSEYQNFYENYLGHWTLYNPFRISYTEETFANDFSPYFLYSGSILQESSHTGFKGAFLDIGDIPAGYVEQTVTRHFPVSADQYRTSLPMTRAAYEYYDPAQNIYHFPGGYGGPEMTGKVTEVLRQGNYYYISCEWSDDSGAYLFSNTVTVELGATDIEFYYKENIVTG